ncbi:hypothetical protein [Pontibacter populi]|nr:hypothetical protein [Pontibacter populi]
MEEHMHPNFIKASNLLLVTVGLGLLNIFFSHETLSSVQNISVASASILFVAALAYFARRGKKWFKYLFLVVMILGVLGLPFIVLNFMNNPIVGFINIVQTILQVWAAVLLFKVPKHSALEPNPTIY